MDKTDKVLKDVLKKITPTGKEREETDSIKKKIVGATQEAIRPHGLDMTLAGSYIRDTWMRHKKEFDVFIVFPEDYGREKLEKLGLEIGKSIARKIRGSFRIAYAEHPYVRARIEGYDVDIVPCYRIEHGSRIKSAVDRTPLHNQFLLQHLKPGMSPHVRLLKQFTTALGVYGSDAKTLGFSGYLCELLIINYGSFRRLAEEASKWEPGQLIDVWGRHKQPISTEKFRAHPLMVIDPVDPGRNVAAILSAENFAAFVNSCRKFSSRPSASFFFRPQPKISLKRLEKKIRSRGTNMVAFVLQSPDTLPDVLYPQLRKASGRISRLLDENGFWVIGSGVWDSGEKCVMLFEMNAHTLPSIRKITGPEIFSKKGSRQFIEKYKKERVWVECGRWAAEVKRNHTTPRPLIAEFMKGSAKKLQEKGIPSYVAMQASKKFSVMGIKEILAMSKSMKFAEFLAGYLERDHTK